MSEREQIVAWLRDRADEHRKNAGLCMFDDHRAQWNYQARGVECAADAIERGDHLKEQP